MEKPAFYRALQLFLVSFLALFFEVLFIRWIPASVQVMAYFPNILLLSAFLGLGLGCLLVERKGLLGAFPLLVLGVVVQATALGRVQVAGSGAQEHLLGNYQGSVPFLPIVSSFILSHTALYVPLGQQLGRFLRSFKPLPGYSLNILGSIAGVGLFTYLAALRTPPVLWFICGLLPALFFFAEQKRQLLLQVILVGVTVWVVTKTNPGAFWSPYYKLDVKPAFAVATGAKVGYTITANNAYHQFALDLRDEAVAAHPELRHFKDLYELPYCFLIPRRVLILGAGSGNDTAAALRRGATDITAVEIDPFIASLGKTLHAEEPYASASVRLAIDDARSFLRKTDRTYDLITFGYLDAHRVLSQFSSVRLDNFIYTKESFLDIKSRLTDDGLVALAYFMFREWIGQRLYATLSEVFGDNVKVMRISRYQENDAVIFLAGPGLRAIGSVPPQGYSWYEGFSRKGLVSTDDWPYLYVAERSVPRHYLQILGVFFLFAVGSLLLLKPQALREFNGHFFFLGAGFMLLETLSITRFALLFGSTWLVNAAVILAILVMIMLANLVVERSKNLRAQTAYVLLFLSLTAHALIKPQWYLSLGRGGSIVAASLILSLPLFFAGIIFARSFKTVRAPAAVFAYNLLGAIAGGVCEYVSMAGGFSLLFPLAFLLYGASYLSLRLRGGSAVAGSGA